MEKSTKDIILSNAGKLFAKNGFSGTSIREISKISNVNISAVNYHFTSKENLFNEVVVNYYQSIDKKITNFCKQQVSLEDFSISVFRFFLDQSDMLLCNYRMYLSDDIKFENKSNIKNRGNFGPPGLQSFKKVVRINYPLLKEEDVLFICNNIFSVICHSAICYISPMLKPKMVKHPFFNKKALETNIIDLINVLTENI
tara:strand:+ start:87 stop:683 length:597 start_codon:yes stop_codon:yes gene_type:complete